MASRKSPSAPAWQVILERIESQNRMTIEAVEASRAVMDDRFRALESHVGWRIGNLGTAMKAVNGRFDRLEALIEAREAALDRRLALIEASLEKIDRDSRARDGSLEVALRELRVSVQQIGAEVHELRTKVQENSADIRDLAGRMGALSRLEERVAALEKRTA